MAVLIPEYTLYLAFPLVGARMTEVLASSAALEVNTAMARLVGVDLHYRAETDVMLLALRFDARTATHTLLARLRSEADAAEAAVLEPARLPDEEKDRFYRTYLPQYSFCLRDFPTVSDAVRSLARDMGMLAEGSARPMEKKHRPKLEVRFRRGDEWQLGRARSLTREGIYVCTGASPRLGDVVDIQITSGLTALTVRAQVVHVTREDAAAALGNAGFAARFLLGGTDEKQRLEQLVMAGRSDGLGTVRPAPPRREARYPIRWPVYLDAPSGQATNAAALDVSQHGIFVSLQGKLAGESVELSFPVDDSGDPVRATARVARSIPKEVAHARGMASGYGLELVHLSAGDEIRFRMFVGRVSRRAERTVLVGASPERAAELCAQLVAAGYIATGMSNPREIVARAATSPPDLVIVDHSLDTAKTGARGLRRALATRSVMTYFLEPDQSVDMARVVADAALLG